MAIHVKSQLFKGTEVDKTKKSATDCLLSPINSAKDLIRVIIAEVCVNHNSVM